MPGRRWYDFGWALRGQQEHSPQAMETTRGAFARSWKRVLPVKPASYDWRRPAGFARPERGLMCAHP